MQNKSWASFLWVNQIIICLKLGKHICLLLVNQWMKLFQRVLIVCFRYLLSVDSKHILCLLLFLNLLSYFLSLSFLYVKCQYYICFLYLISQYCNLILTCQILNLFHSMAFVAVIDCYLHYLYTSIIKANFHSKVWLLPAFSFYLSIWNIPFLKSDFTYHFANDVVLFVL